VAAVVQDGFAVGAVELGAFECLVEAAVFDVAPVERRAGAAGEDVVVFLGVAGGGLVPAASTPARFSSGFTRSFPCRFQRFCPCSCWEGDLPPADIDRVVLLATWATRPRSRIDSIHSRS